MNYWIYAVETTYGTIYSVDLDRRRDGAYLLGVVWGDTPSSAIQALVDELRCLTEVCRADRDARCASTVDSTST